MTNLPGNWENLSLPQQLGALFTEIQLSSSKTDSTLVNPVGRIESLFETVKLQSERFDKLETENQSLRRELGQLKESRVNFSTSTEVKVTGISTKCDIPLGLLPNIILGELGVPSLNNDVLEIRKIKPEKSTKVLGSQKDKSQNDTFSCVIKFKSVCIRNHVLKVKRRFGEFYAKDIIPDMKFESKIGIFEMLPQTMHELRLKTKERAEQRNYKYVWVREGTLFTKKDKDSERIAITSDLDLERIL
ncbi:hypothetical protein QAD02_003277 [Eretmocerus hayati]|uniref:Uncharacterized protein n=1 Tax=Eretmocerus hayati TaxID=131215 RepID=A0ACC2NMI0_9HYME|nr:hypothetical protein QAD02_003277 [Eretmocerus hayati]